MALLESMWKVLYSDSSLLALIAEVLLLFWFIPIYLFFKRPKKLAQKNYSEGYKLGEKFAHEVIKNNLHVNVDYITTLTPRQKNNQYFIRGYNAGYHNIMKNQESSHD